MAAEEAYRGPSQPRLEPQPGLALLRFVQGRSDEATAAIRRVASTMVGRLKAPAESWRILPGASIRGCQARLPRRRAER